jgi:hypothetical protein
VVVTSQDRRGPVMACWQRNRQLTQPPPADRRRRADIAAVSTTATAAAAPAVATNAATRMAAVAKKWLTGPENASQATIRMAVTKVTGRA